MVYGVGVGINGIDAIICVGDRIYSIISVGDRIYDIVGVVNRMDGIIGLGWWWHI